MPKLEEGKTATGYIPHENDLIGEDGQPGTPGGKGADAPYYKYKYQWSGSRTAYPTPFDPTALNAGSDNWKDIQPTKPGTLYYLWSTVAKVSADGSTLIENWSPPVRTTPVESSLKIEVRGARHDGSTSIPENYVKVYGNDITGSRSRGLNLTVLNAGDLTVAFQGAYDTYSDTKSSQTATLSLYNKLVQYANASYIIVLSSYDAIGLFSKLYTYLQKFGCSYRTPEVIAQRYAFAFIGRWGLKPGQGYTKTSFSDYTVDVAASVVDGELVANGSDGQPGENLVDNSEIAESYSVTDSSSTPQYFTTGKAFSEVPGGRTISGQARVTLSGCTFKSAGARILIYFQGGSSSSDITKWPAVCEVAGITQNGVYDLKTELTNVADVAYWQKAIWVRLDNFYTGGTITIERVKVEEGGSCSEWTPSQNDRKGASTPFRGVYDSTKTYYGTLRRTDVVKYNEVYYVARADVGAFAGHEPTDTDYWNEYGANFESVATQLLFAEFAYVENLGVRDLQTATEGKRVHISADENAMTIYDEDGQTSAVFSGDQFADSQLFGGADQTVSPSSIDTSYQSGNVLHPDMDYTSTTSNGTFNFPYAGVFNGTVQISSSFTNTLKTDDTKQTREFSVHISVLLDNVQIGYLSPISGGGTGSKTQSFTFSKGIAAGTHTLKSTIRISVPNYSSGSLYVNEEVSFSGCKASADIRMARYFANGQAVGCSSSQYIETLIESNKLLHKIRAGNCGIQLQDGTFKIMIAGVWYTCSRDSSTGALKLTS